MNSPVICLEIEKGIVLTKQWADDYEAINRQWLNFWMLYPDMFLDAIHDDVEDPNFKLFDYQRIALRAGMRYRYHSFTATRATSKSFIAYLTIFLKAVFLPKSNLFICSDVKGTVIKIASAKFDEIWQHWPLLRNELATREDDGKAGEKRSNDYFELRLKNGSMITVIAKDSSRGLRATAGIIEEAALIPAESLNEVILPMMNIDRRLPDGTTDPNEPNQAQSFITTAGPKSCFMYHKLIELVTMSVIRPSEYFIWGMDYRVPVRYGLLNKKFLDEQRLSSTFSDEGFSRENLSIWTGASKEAWLDTKILNKRRTLLMCERAAQLSGINPNAFYIIGIDVARYSVNTAIIVIKVLPTKSGFKKHIVYTEIIHGENFISQQAPRIKELIELYAPREVVIDGNGVGAGLLDAMSLPSFNKKMGKQYPAYYAFNNNEHLPPEMKVPRDEPAPHYNAILYDLKANASNTDQIHANIFAQLNNSSISFLAHERVVKEKLLSTKKGQRMDLYDRRLYLLPYEMTSRLMDELANLRLKPTGMQNQIKVEQISSTTPKDRFSALEYGLWRVKYYEDKENHHVGKKDFSKYSFFTPKSRR